MDQFSQRPNEQDSLEESQDSLESTSSSSDQQLQTGQNSLESEEQHEQLAQQKQPRKSFFKRFQHINIYLLIFVLLVIVCGGIAGVLFLNSKKTNGGWNID